ncbi:MAG: patatin-like phospholipase family protein [Steroidobacteraceae bacterium]
MLLRSFKLGAAVLLLPLLAACTTSVAYLGDSISQVDETQGYRLAKAVSSRPKDDLLVIVSLSGGGLRASAMAFGVLEQLATDQIQYDGKLRRMLDEVDVISAVSGGAIPAAYFVLYGDRIFEQFPRDFLYRDFAADVRRAVLFDPRSWFRLSSKNYDRGDFYAEYLDKNLFDGIKYSALIDRADRPFLVINATDIGIAGRFEFTQDTFDLLCLDLAKFPISRAVAASSSVPAVLSPITIRNSAGRCGYRMPSWALRAVESRDHSSREHFRAETMLARSDSKTYGYLHLMDGALSDNLGVRSTLDALTDSDDALHFQNVLQRSGIRKVVFITLNASDTQWTRIAGRRSPPDVIDMLKLVGTVPMDRYSVESKALLKETLASWATRLSPDNSANALYFIDLSLDRLREHPRFREMTQIETTFSLKPAQVDELRCAAKLLLSSDPEYQRLLNSQNGGATAPAACSW